MPGDIPAGPLPIAIGCMRLSTAADRDDDRAIAVLHAALDAGVTLLDTANAYCWDDSETGHNERLIARALRTTGSPVYSTPSAEPRPMVKSTSSPQATRS